MREEIERKALDAAIWLESKREAGTLTNQEIYVGQEVLFMVVSGLIGREVFELISAEQPEIESTVKEA